MFAQLSNQIHVFYRKADPAVAQLFSFADFPHRTSIETDPSLPRRIYYRTLTSQASVSELPSNLNFQDTFANLMDSTTSFLNTLRIKRLSVYLFDYDALTTLRIALQRLRPSQS